MNPPPPTAAMPVLLHAPPAGVPAVRCSRAIAPPIGSAAGRGHHDVPQAGPATQSSHRGAALVMLRGAVAAPLRATVVAAAHRRGAKIAVAARHGVETATETAAVVAAHQQGVSIVVAVGHGSRAMVAAVRGHHAVPEAGPATQSSRRGAASVMLRGAAAAPPFRATVAAAAHRRDTKITVAGRHVAATATAAAAATHASCLASSAPSATCATTTSSSGAMNSLSNTGTSIATSTISRTPLTRPCGPREACKSPSTSCGSDTPRSRASRGITRSTPSPSRSRASPPRRLAAGLAVLHLRDRHRRGRHHRRLRLATRHTLRPTLRHPSRRKPGAPRGPAADRVPMHRTRSTGPMNIQRRQCRSRRV